MSERVGEVSSALVEAQDGHIVQDLDLIKVHMDQTSRTPLLDKQEEHEHAKTIEAGVLAGEKLALAEARGEPLPLDLELDLRELVREGESSIDHMLRANTRLVKTIAGDYVGKGLDELDLIQEGSLGLLHAIEKYDYTVETARFATYAAYWIRQSMRRALSEQSRTIKLPGQIVEQLLTCYSAANTLRHKLSTEPTIAQIADKTKLKPETVADVLAASQPSVLMSQPTEGDLTIGDLVSDKQSEDVRLTPAQMGLRDEVESVQTVVLTDEERTIVELRFGRKEPLTRKEIAEYFAMSKVTVETIERRALAKMAHPALGLQDRLLEVRKRESWQQEAACKDEDIINFFPRDSKKESRQTALQLCASCPVATECASYAFRNDITAGIWGGLAARERRRRKLEAIETP